jgi:hypothetical protein
LYDLIDDPHESHDLTATLPEIAARMRTQLLEWNTGVDDSFAGRDYPAGTVSPPDPEPVNWYELPQYQPYLAEWRSRPEFRQYLRRAARQTEADAGDK